MSDLLIIWLVLGSIFFGFPVIYRIYMGHLSSQPWNLKTDKNYFPTVTILVPTYNEAEIIDFKLENLKKLKYPRELIQILLVDSGSQDSTLEKIEKFLRNNPSVKFKVIKETERKGKSNALNFALKHATGEIISVSDADCFLLDDVLEKSLKYLADPTIGAIVGREVILNPNRTWVTKNEALYRSLMSCIRLGESKFYSTIIFEGGFSAYKRDCLEKFDSETGCDDTGTALNVVQKNARTILIPEATFFTAFPTTWNGKITIKIRRGSQLVQIWTKCLMYLLRKSLVLPKRIAISEIFLHVFNPIIFSLLVLISFFVILQYPLLLFGIIFVLIVPTTRNLLVETVQNNVILLAAFISLILKRRFVIWQKADESRQELTRELLEQHNLI
ncbi:MAG: glycosyltransferase [Candidatus Bathyarchaeota archaeon]|nr:glycosyltransferase [Mycoplasmatota bacterium]MDG6222388.1 glycosyltransferase [Candidatus Bathyarchaeum tardum]